MIRSFSYWAGQRPIQLFEKRVGNIEEMQSGEKIILISSIILIQSFIKHLYQSKIVGISEEKNIVPSLFFHHTRPPNIVVQS